MKAAEWARLRCRLGWSERLRLGVGHASTARPEPPTLGAVGDRGSRREGRWPSVPGSFSEPDDRVCSSALVARLNIDGSYAACSATTDEPPPSRSQGAGPRGRPQDQSRVCALDTAFRARHRTAAPRRCHQQRDEPTPVGERQMQQVRADPGEHCYRGQHGDEGDGAVQDPLPVQACGPAVGCRMWASEAVFFRSSVSLVGGFDASTERVDDVGGRKAQRCDHPDQLASVLVRLGDHRVREHGDDRTCSERENEANRFR